MDIKHTEENKRLTAIGCENAWLASFALFGQDAFPGHRFIVGMLFP